MPTKEIWGKLRVRFFQNDDIAGLQAFCPACDFEHCFNIDVDGHGNWNPSDRPKWEFDGNFESPTFAPSMLANRDGFDEHHPICHSFLEGGKWNYLDDCSHAMAGVKGVEVPAPNPEHSFQRQHGFHLYPHYEGPI